MAQATMLQTIADRLQKVGELELWRQVPDLVVERYKAAAAIQSAICHLPEDSGSFGQVFWQPETKTAWVAMAESDSEETTQQCRDLVRAAPGVVVVKTAVERCPSQPSDWILVKRSSALSWLSKPYGWAGIPSGGASPMSNALVSGLLGAGAGYLGGTIAENLMPEEYVERGKLRRLAAMVGGLGGAAVHIPQFTANVGMNREATGKPHWLRSAFMGTNHQNIAPHEPDWEQNFRQGQGPGQMKSGAWEAMLAVCGQLPQPPKLFLKAAAGTGAFGSPDAALRPVPVDSFNQAIWNDVHAGPRSSQSNRYGTRSPYSDNTDGFHTPPAHAAATTGLVSGIQQMYGNPSYLSPVHFIRGLAGAGVDLATAHAAGGVLGALGGLSPAGQRQLQDMGLWSGLIRGVTSSVLGLP